jgi:hypothetical protein
MVKRVILESDDEDEDQESESPPQKRTRVARKPSQRQAQISMLNLLPLLNRLSLNIHIQFTDKENEETEQNKIARMEKEILRLKRKNKKVAEGMLLIRHRNFFFSNQWLLQRLKNETAAIAMWRAKMRKMTSPFQAQFVFPVPFAVFPVSFAIFPVSFALVLWVRILMKPVRRFNLSQPLQILSRRPQKHRGG